MNTLEQEKNQKIKLDLGCGSKKKKGTIGIDYEPCDGVDYVLDIQNESLPFSDNSVDSVFSSHFLEHLEDPSKVFSEISRVCKNNAQLELWTPYAWSNSAFIFGHKFFFTEEIYLHLCCYYPEHWANILKARWVLKEITYVIHPDTILQLQNNGINLDFALKHCNNIVLELGIFIEVRKDDSTSTVEPPLRTFTFGREHERYKIKQPYKKGKLYNFQLGYALIKEIGIKKTMSLARKFGFIN